MGPHIRETVRVEPPPAAADVPPALRPPERPPAGGAPRPRLHIGARPRPAAPGSVDALRDGRARRRPPACAPPPGPAGCPAGVAPLPPCAAHPPRGHSPASPHAGALPPRLYERSPRLCETFRRALSGRPPLDVHTEEQEHMWDWAQGASTCYICRKSITHGAMGWRVETPPNQIRAHYLAVEMQGKRTRGCCELLG